MAPRALGLLWRYAALLAATGAGAARDIYIIGAGLPRTGSQSLAIALNKLGYKTAHSVLPVERQLWCDWLGREGSFEPALRTIADQNATAVTDQPAALAYKELLRRFPSAKVILTLHEDTDSWYESLSAHVQHWSPVVYNPGLCSRLLLNFHPYSGFVGGVSVSKHLECARMMAERYSCQGLFSDPDSEEVREACIAGYNRHTEEVKQAVPPSQLLVFRSIDGWAPLCDFLGVPAPLEPFPASDGSLALAAALSAASCSMLFRAVWARLWPVHFAVVLAALWHQWKTRRRGPPLESAEAKED